jgi:t-SNARE complex subunit (syntaxin)
LAKQVAKTVEPQAPTEAELKLKQEAENAKNKLIAEIKQFKIEDEAQTDEEAENPRVQKFVVNNPVKI